MESSDRAGVWIAASIGSAMFLGIFTLATICTAITSHFEARAYNRLTGSDVTTWEAMFVELRVQAEPKR